MTTLRAIVTLLAGAVLVACSEPPPPKSVDELIADPILLEAVMVRCEADRAKTRYDSECVNARVATDRIAAREEAERRAEFEVQSERKRQALRRAQQAAAEARRRAAESRRLREEAEYLAQFGQLPPGAEPAGDSTDNAPGVVISPPPAEDSDGSDVIVTFDEPAPRPGNAAPPPADGSNAPAAETESQKDLSEIREELRRRNESGGA